MSHGEGAYDINAWGIELFRTLEGSSRPQRVSKAAYDASLAQTSSREEARRDRTHGAEGVIPASVWVVLLFSAGIVFALCSSSPTPANAQSCRRC